jgi:hypothetical protein
VKKTGTLSNDPLSLESRGPHHDPDRLARGERAPVRHLKGLLPSFAEVAATRAPAGSSECGWAELRA